MLSKTSLSRLDEVINEASDPAESECELLREHLESARTYLLGEMHEEYTLTLRLAEEALSCVTNHDRRERLNETIAGLLAEED